jgi:hypothetical protein
MSQTWHSNGSDSRESQQGDYPAASPCSVLEHVYPLVDPAVLVQENSGVAARGPHIVLTCGPQDDDDENCDE